MKKIILISLLIVALLFCIGCEKDDPKADNDTQGNLDWQLPEADAQDGITLPEDIFD